MEREVKNCPKCDSENIKKNGPFSPRAKNGEEFASKPHPAQYYCLDCKHNWSNSE